MVKKKKRHPAAQKKANVKQVEETRKTSKFPIIAIIAIIAVIAVAAVGTIFLLKKDTPIEAKGHNLLIITLDTTRADRIGAYGYDIAHTPTLDRLAREGVLFENCYSPVPLTLPAHSSIFTGRYPLGHGVRGNGQYVLPEKELTLAEIMQTQGYQTYGVIASFVLLAKFGLNQGFNQYDDSLESHKMYNNYTSEIPCTDVYRKFTQWFEKHHQERFFAWIHFYDPHAPYSPPGQFARKFSNDSKGRYDGEIAFTDEAVNKVLQALETKKVIENTLVVIVGDHGEAFGEHGETEHGFFCYEEAIRVPLIFYSPKLFENKGVRVKNRVNITDIMPTLLELYQMDKPSNMQGESFASMLKGKREKKQRTFYIESMHGKDEMGWAPLMGILDDEFKYISLPEPELYDLNADPGEKDNLFRKKNYLAKNLDKKLMKLVSKLSKSGSGEEAKRNLTAEDKQHLTSLGYISSFSGKTETNRDPKEGIVLDNKIKRLFEVIGKGNLQQAEADIRELIALHADILKMPIFYDLQYQLQMKRQDNQKIIEVLQEALEKFPKIERFYILYAFKVMEQGDLEKTESICRQLIQLNPQFTRAYILLAEIEEKRGNINDELNYYQKALNIEPQNISLKLKLAGLMMKLGRFKEAVTLYDDLLERKEVARDPELLFKVALLNAQHGSLSKAEELLKETVTIKPTGQHFFNYAMILYRAGKIDDALTNMKIVLDKYASEMSPRHIQVAQKAVAAWERR